MTTVAKMLQILSIDPNIQPELAAALGEIANHCQIREPCPVCINGQVPRYDAQGQMAATDRCLCCNGLGYTLVEADLSGYSHRAGSDEPEDRRDHERDDADLRASDAASRARDMNKASR